MMINYKRWHYLQDVVCEQLDIRRPADNDAVKLS